MCMLKIANELTEMSTTGEDFLAGQEVVIERYDDEDLVDTMTIEHAIDYASVFALGVTAP